MPTHLRIFFWLIAAVSAYWVLSMLWVMEFPPAEISSMLARLPAAVRAQIQERAWHITLVSTIIRVLIFFGLAWFAAFRRQNWARWTLLVIFIATHAVPFGAAVYLNRVPQFMIRYHDLQADLAALVIAIALAFAFTGNAREAFGRA